MTIKQVEATPSFVDEGNDYTERYIELIKASPDYLKWFEEPDKIISFVQEFTASRRGEVVLRFVGSVEGIEIAFVGVTGMELPSPEIQITVKEGYRGKGYGKEILLLVITWLFDHTEKDVFLYRIVADNLISEKLVKSIGGLFREPKYELEHATVKTYEIRKDRWMNNCMHG